MSTATDESTSHKSLIIDDDDTTALDDATSAEFAGLIAEVRSSLPAAAVEADEESTEEESKDQVHHLNEHMDINGLTLDEKSDNDTHTHSGASSASNSVSASPAVAPSASSTSASSHAAMAALPTVELKDGGNAIIQDTSEPKKDFFDVRVAIVGKSTLIGVLTGGALDDGRGKARSKVFIHAHELGTGRTSAVSQHIMGFDKEGQPVHQPIAASAQSAAKSKSWSSVIAASKSILTFIDLAGHEKYLKTTIAGLTGSHPDYACVLVNSLAGVTKMTKEHLGTCLALEIPLICIVTKVDLAPTTVLEASKKQLFRILKSSAANKIPIQMRSEKDIETVITNSENSKKICPVFFISAVNGTHIPLLTSYLSKLRPHHEWLNQYASNLGVPRSIGSSSSDASSSGSSVTHPNACDFSIDEIFNVSGVGIVVSGTLNSGTLHTNSTLLLGPQSDNSWTQVLVRSLHYKRVLCSSVSAGQSCAISIRAVKRKETLKRNLIRRGMALVDPIVQPQSTRIFDAEILILHHPTTIARGYQSVLHIGMVRQTAQICRIHKSCLRTGDKSICRFRFLQREEYIHVGTPFVFREGSCKGIGKVTRVRFTPEEIHELEEEERQRKRQVGKSQLGPAKNAIDEENQELNTLTSATSDQSTDEKRDSTNRDGARAHSSAAAAASTAPTAAASSTSATAHTAAAAGAVNKQKWTAQEKHDYHKQLHEKHK